MFLGRFICTVFAVVVMNVASAESNATPSKLPSVMQLRASSMPSYKPGAEVTEECLGRIVWSSDKDLTWSVYRDRNAEFTHSFSKNVFSRGDEIRFGNTQIAVHEIEPAVKQAILDSLPQNILVYLKNKLALADAELKKQEKRRSNGFKEQEAYEDILMTVENTKKTIREIVDKHKPFSAGLPDSYGYQAEEEEASGNGDRYSIYRAYLFRSDYVYTFESKEVVTEKNSAELNRNRFLAQLAKFRTRRLNEIPAEPGVCIPFGFLPDDGRTITDIKQSVRWADAPGVLYTIHTGNVQRGQIKSTVVTSLASSQVGRFGSDEEAEIKKHIDQRIGPRQAKIGGVAGEQGGVALKIRKAQGKPYEAYSVFTGYAGWLGTDVLPFILVDMQSFTMDQAPELNVNPPPFKQSMERLDAMLRYMRIRSTNPPMPELAAGK